MVSVVIIWELRESFEDSYNGLDDNEVSVDFESPWVYDDYPEEDCELTMGQ